MGSTLPEGPCRPALSNTFIIPTSCPDEPRKKEGGSKKNGEESRGGTRVPRNTAAGGVLPQREGCVE